jgi:hypothetical protein
MIRAIEKGYNRGGIPCFAIGKVFLTEGSFVFLRRAAPRPSATTPPSAIGGLLCAHAVLTTGWAAPRGIETAPAEFILLFASEGERRIALNAEKRLIVHPVRPLMGDLSFDRYGPAISATATQGCCGENDALRLSAAAPHAHRTWRGDAAIRGYVLARYHPRCLRHRIPSCISILN